MFQSRPADARLTLVLLALTCAMSPRLGAGDTKSFENKTYGYRVQYPRSWRPQIVSDVFYIENFPPSKMVRAVRLPEGGAGIHVSVPSRIIRKGQAMPRNLEEWATLGTGRITVIGKRTLEVGDDRRKLPVIEVKTLCCAVPPYQESVDWYFQINDRMFSGSLLYWQGDPNAARLVEVLRQVVLSIRLTP